MKIKIIINAVCIFLLGCVMAGCNNFDDPDTYDRNAVITDIYVETSSLTLIAGGSRTITFWPLPANADPMKLEWTSSNPSVVTIDRWGRLTTHSAGTATLTISSGTVSKTVGVTVTPDPSDLAAFVVGNYSGTAQISGLVLNENVSNVSVKLDRIDTKSEKVDLTLTATTSMGLITIIGEADLEKVSNGYTLNGNASLTGMADFTVTGSVEDGTLTLDLDSEIPGFVIISITATK